MLIEFPEFENYLLDRNHQALLIKGKQFLDKGRIKHIHAFSGTEWDIFVTSESGAVPGYSVRIQIDGGRVIYYNCNCPGFRMMPLCKHIVASLFAIKERNLYNPDLGDYETEDTELIDDEKDVESETNKKDKGIVDEEIKADKELKKRGTKRNPEEYDLIDKALECEACHELLEHPIMMPCYSHSICQSCVNEMIKNNKEKNEVVTCPKCGVSGKKEKVNVTLEKLKHYVIKDRKGWQSEKENLKKEIQRLKSEIKSKESTQETEKAQSQRDDINEKVIERKDSEQLRDFANLAVEELKRRDENLDDLSKIVDSSKRKDVGGDAKREKFDKITKIQENMVDETQEGAEKYDLRERKKIKTD